MSRKSGEVYILRGRFWTCNWYAAAIIAKVTEGIDWAAYAGGGSAESREGLELVVSQNGDKLSEEDARYFFPQLAKLPYRV